MRAAVIASFILSALAGCRSGDAASAIRELYGEVHIHGFPNGFHPAATFVAHGVRAASVKDVSILEDGTARREGDCLIATSSAAPAKAPSFEMIDAGPVHILGGLGVARVDLAYASASSCYLPTGPLSPGKTLFQGGERLTIQAEGNATVPAFSGTLEAPRALVLTAPAALQVGRGALVVTWQAEHADHVELALIASKTDGRWTAIRCSAPDRAGAFTFGSALLAQLPPAPRDLQLEVSRNQVVRAVSATAGRGVILHANYAVKLVGRDER